jgi:gamma-glutamyltranspeptidase/glutathione hydrolase
LCLQCHLHQWRGLRCGGSRNRHALELVLGSAGSNRIRSAILQTIIGVVDRDLDVRQAVEAPRVHFEDGVVFAEPGIDLSGMDGDAQVVRFGAPNLFFGGVQAALRRDSGVTGAGDPRRGGVAVSE